MAVPSGVGPPGRPRCDLCGASRRDRLRLVVRSHQTTGSLAASCCCRTRGRERGRRRKPRRLSPRAAPRAPGRPSTALRVGAVSERGSACGADAGNRHSCRANAARLACSPQDLVLPTNCRVAQVDVVVLALAGTGTALATGLGAIPVSRLGDHASTIRPGTLGPDRRADVRGLGPWPAPSCLR